MILHAAEARGFRELVLYGRRLAAHWRGLAAALGDPQVAEPLRAGADAAAGAAGEISELAARRGLGSKTAAEAAGDGLGRLRCAIADRFLERGQAVRLAIGELEHVCVLLAHLGELAETRGDAELAEACRSRERSLRRRIAPVRKAAIAMGSDPDAAIRPLDASPLGRAGHRAARATGALGEWIDGRAARRR